MRLYKVVIVVNIALGTGYLFGYHFWGQEVIKLRREVAAAKQAPTVGQGEARSWRIKGIVRSIAPGLLFVTHEPIPGLMGSMTMGFRTENPKLLQGLDAGDTIVFTLKESNGQLVVVALEKENKS